MARTTPGIRPAGTKKAKKSSNPLIAMFQSRKEQRQQQEEQRAHEAELAVTNQQAENEQSLISLIESIDFARSQIPQQYLNYKKNPKQPCGDLEYSARGIVSRLRQAPGGIPADISVIDRKLYQMGIQFRDAVANGNVNAAYAAKSGLVTCIIDVRHKIPNVQPSLAGAFIKNSEGYLDTWLLLISISTEADEQQRAVDRENQKYAALQQQLTDENNQLLKRIKEDPELLAAFIAISEKTAPEDYTKWSKAEIEVRRLLTDQTFKKFNHSLSMTAARVMADKLAGMKARIEALSIKVEQRPVPTDPDSLNKYNAEMKSFLDALAQMDVETDELITSMEEIEEALNTMNNSAPAVHIRNKAAARAKEIIAEKQAEQQKILDTARSHSVDFLKENNILSEEELQKELAKIRDEQAVLNPVTDAAEDIREAAYYDE